MQTSYTGGGMWVYVSNTTGTCRGYRAARGGGGVRTIPRCIEKEHGGGRDLHTGGGGVRVCVCVWVGRVRTNS